MLFELLVKKGSRDSSLLLPKDDLTGLVLAHTHIHSSSSINNTNIHTADDNSNNNNNSEEKSNLACLASACSVRAPSCWMRCTAKAALACAQKEPLHLLSSASEQASKTRCRAEGELEWTQQVASSLIAASNGRSMRASIFRPIEARDKREKEREGKG